MRQLHYYQDISHFRAPYKNMPMGEESAPEPYVIKEYGGYKYRAIGAAFVPAVAITLNQYELTSSLQDDFGKRWVVGVLVSGAPVANESNAAQWVDATAKNGSGILLRRYPGDRIGLTATSDVSKAAVYINDPDVAVLAEPAGGWNVPAGKRSWLAKAGVSPAGLAVGLVVAGAIAVYAYNR